MSAPEFAHRSDTLVDPLLVELVECLQRQLIHTAHGPALRAYVVHNAGAPTDDGCTCTGEVLVDGIPVAANGDARARVVSLAPDQRGGNSAAGFRVCPPGWVATVELSTSRCIPVPPDERPAPAGELTQIALALGDDRAALVRVLACCELFDDADVMVDDLRPVGPMGGCAGWSMTVRVTVLDQSRGCR